MAFPSRGLADLWATTPPDEKSFRGGISGNKVGKFIWRNKI